MIVENLIKIHMFLARYVLAIDYHFSSYCCTHQCTSFKYQFYKLTCNLESTTSLWNTWYNSWVHCTTSNIGCGAGAGAVSSMSWVERTVNVPATSLDISGLMKWSCYEVQVRAVTIKNGIYSVSVKEWTSENGKRIYLLTPCVTCLSFNLARAIML